MILSPKNILQYLKTFLFVMTRRWRWGARGEMLLEFVGKCQRCWLYSLAGTARTEYHSLCGIIHRDLIFSCSRGCKSKIKMPPGFGSPCGLSPWPTEVCFLAVFSQSLVTVYTHSQFFRVLISFSYKDTSQIRLGPTQITSV